MNAERSIITECTALSMIKEVSRMADTHNAMLNIIRELDAAIYDSGGPMSSVGEELLHLRSLAQGAQTSLHRGLQNIPFAEIIELMPSKGYSALEEVIGNIRKAVGDTAQFPQRMLVVERGTAVVPTQSEQDALEAYGIHTGVRSA